MSAPLGILDLAEKIIVTRWLRAVDTIEVVLDARRNYADQIARNRVLYLPRLDFSAPLAFLIETIARDRDSKKKQLSVHGRTLDGIALAARLAWPDPANYPADTAGYDEQTSVKAETALKHYVDLNAGPSAAADRRVPGFAIATDALRGATGSWAVRYQQLLDIAKEISFAADLGWKVTFEAGTDLHTFEIIVPVDRSASVFLDFEFGTISEWHEIESQADSRTLAVVAGQGELTDRDVVIRPAVEPTGFARREVFVDARDVVLGNTDLLEQRGDAVLAASGPTRGVTVVARQGAQQYPTDYGLGDYVLARDAERGVSFVAQVIGVKITVDKSAAVPTIEPILDKPEPGDSGGSFSGGRVDQGGSISITAAQVPIVDSANDFTATEVEGALAELQADAEADAQALVDHIGDTADAHDASAISIVDTANDFTATDVEAALAELQSDAEALPLNAAAYGFLPANSAAVNTAALQSFVTDVVTGHRAGVIPDGTYHHNGNIAFPATYGWSIAGGHRESCKLICDTDNVPHFSLGASAVDTMHSWNISGMTFDYLNAQTTSDTDANCLWFEREALQGVIRDVNFFAGYYGMASKAGVFPPWGTTFDSLVFGGTISGGAINFPYAGGPGNHFGQLYVLASSAVGPLFIISGDATWIDSIEVNEADAGPVIMQPPAGGTLNIGGMRLENGNYASDTSLFEFAAGHIVDIGSFSISGNSMVIDGAGVVLNLFKAGGGATPMGRLHIGSVVVDVTPTNGAVVYVVESQVWPTTIDYVYLTGASLLDQGSTITAEHTAVTDHNRRRLSSDLGNANYTTTLGGYNILSFETTFTAQRTVNLFDATNYNDWFNGLAVDIRCYGAINGANTLLVKVNGTTIHTQATDKVVLGFTYRRYPGNQFGGWVLTKYETLP